ncbi:hypothetical protein [Actinomadura sp. B10D3]|uniref:hypothetical protein n=1 Tax=Actinomadura sp. B10D3 TaxID=3153557 RepID=UPI00325E0236
MPISRVRSVTASASVQVPVAVPGHARLRFGPDDRAAPVDDGGEQLGCANRTQAGLLARDAGLG